MAILLGSQLTGVVLSRLILPVLPGPVMGLILCLPVCIAMPRLADMLRPTANSILAHPSLLFVAAGLGLFSHWRVFTADCPALLVASVGSTLMALSIGAVVLSAVARALAL